MTASASEPSVGPAPGLPEASTRVVVAICVLSAFVAQGFVLAPVFYGALAESRGYGAAELGRIAALAGVGGLLTAVSSPLWLPQAPLRQTAVGLVLAAAGALLYLMFGAHTPSEAMLAIGVQGIATGALYTLMFGALSLYARPERTLAWKLGTESKPGIATLYVVSNYVAPRAGFAGVVAAILCTAAVAGAAAFLLPTTRPKQSALTAAPGAAMGSLGLWLAVAAAVVLWTGVTAVWTFVERIGARRGLSGETIGLVLTLGWLFASLGALAVVGIGNRFGTVKPYLLGAGLSLLALLLFQGSSVGAYMIAASLFITASVFAAVYAIAQITRLNTHPLYAGLGSVALQGAVAAGPPIGGYLIEARGVGSTFIFAAICVSMSLVLYLAARAAGRARAASAQ